jgi:hypothetical protein
LSKRQSDPLDNAFLFLLGSLSLFFGLLNAAFGSKGGLLLFSPLVVSGFFYPFYVGYIRGVIESLPLERIKGWIYFFGGTLTYLFMFVIVIFRDYLKTLDYISTPVALLVLVLGGLCARYSMRWVLRVTGITITSDIRVNLHFTGFAAFALSASAFSLEEYIRLYVEPNTLAPPDLWHLVPSVMFFLFFLFVQWISKRH